LSEEPTGAGAARGGQGSDGTMGYGKPLLGQILQDKFGLSAQQIEAALSAAREKRGRLGDALVTLGHVRDEQVLEALSRQLDLPWLPALDPVRIDATLASRVPLSFAKRYLVMPLWMENGTAVVAVADPLGVSLNDVRLLLGCPVSLVLTTSVALLASVNQVYDRAESSSAEQVIEDFSAGEQLSQLASEATQLDEPTDLLDSSEEAPVIRLVNSILFQAARQRASDIHFEPYERSLVVRYRIDGILYPVLTVPKRLQAGLTTRVKIMAGLNIAEKRLPQDGRFGIRTAGKAVDIRVSVLPTAHGERVVLRLLDKSTRVLTLEELGLSSDRLARMAQVIGQPHGIVLVTGPTGSGKTTTLYAALSQINAPERNILTIEDPIEYELAGVGQMQVNPKIELTFAAGLRSILRQDPDVIMIGEIRDRDTAEIAIHASLTGHLVFSTLHTNDAASAVTRLIDMGIEPFLVSSSVVAILAQRLVRVLCPACRQPYQPTAAELAKLGVAGDSTPVLHRSAGCAACVHTGYKGRTGIYELLVLDDEMRHLILTSTDAVAVTRQAVQRGMITLREDGARKVVAGVTTTEEVLRIVQQDVQ